MDKKRILLVEDNLNDAELAIRALKKCEIEIDIVHLKDGEEALVYLFDQTTDSPLVSDFSLILLDINMPKVSGLDVLKEIKSNHKTSFIPVVILTSSKEDSDVKFAYELGANSYIVKPVEYDPFIQVVKTSDTTGYSQIIASQVNYENAQGLTCRRFLFRR